MNYKLCLYDIEDNRKVIDTAKMLKNKKEQFDLIAIDEFTMIFNGEERLIDYLISQKLISESDRSGELTIEYGDEYAREIRLLYSIDKEVFLKIRNFAIEIKNYFKDRKHECKNIKSYSDIMGEYPYVESDFKKFKVMARNIEFLEALQIFISPNPAQQTNIKALNNYINNPKRDPKSKDISIILYECFRRIFYKFDHKEKTLKFNYKGYRDFAVFYIDFKEKYNSKKNEENISNDAKDSVDDYIEPVFPPNSEELREYQKYLDNLPDEEHPHRYR